MKRIILLTCAFGILFQSFVFPAQSANEKKFKFSFSERLRFVSWDNAINLDDGSGEVFSFTRHRTTMGFLWTPGAGVEFNVKLTNEFRNYLSPKNREFDINEIVFDNLYIKFKDPGKLPLTLTLGRQNIMLGEGFVVMDGNPLTGSRTIFFNGVRADYRLNKNHNVSLFYVYMPETDNILPVINSLDQVLIEQPEKGLGVYYTGLFKKIRFESYFVRKNVEATDARPLESAFNTLGLRFSVPFNPAASLTVEAAYQSGTWGLADRSALGGYFHFDWKFPGDKKLLKKITLGGIYLSGDDPATLDFEGWDPVFSRWPKWSESFIYTLIRENGVAYWSNLNSIYLKMLLQLSPKINLDLAYHFLGAQEAAKAVFPGGNGKNRGNLLIGKLNFPINKYITGHFLWENFKPGNYYFTGADGYNWIRFELLFRF